MTSAISFGLNIPPSAVAGADPVALARTAERVGFDYISASDHPCGTDPSYETWTMLTWIAASTSRITIGTRVLGVPYRNPALVAKMAETLDRLSGGRLILGLGGGYSDAEFRAFGQRVPTAREKVDGLEDAIRIARGLWSEPDFSYAGPRHSTHRATIAPQAGRPIPIWLGTFGPRALDLTGRLADGWIPSLGHAPPDRVVEMRERVLAAARSAGRDPAQITCAYNLGIRIDPDADVETDLRDGIVSGTAQAVVDRLAGFVERGFTSLSLGPVGGPDGLVPHEQVERIATEILPRLRG